MMFQRACSCWCGFDAVPFFIWKHQTRRMLLIQNPSGYPPFPVPESLLLKNPVHLLFEGVCVRFQTVKASGEASTDSGKSNHEGWRDGTNQVLEEAANVVGWYIVSSIGIDIHFQLYGCGASSESS